MYKDISRSEFVNYGDTPLSHTIYKGSDDIYHYFVWSYEKSSGGWKISKKQLSLNCEEALDENFKGLFIVQENSEDLLLWGC